MTLEKAFAESLMTIACQPVIDQYGSRREPFLVQAVTHWVNNNQETISKLLNKELSKESFAADIAKKYKDSMNSYDRDRFNTNVDELFKNKLAEMLAKDEYERLKGLDKQSPLT